MVLNLRNGIAVVRARMNSSGLNQGSIPVVVKRSKPLVMQAKPAMTPCFMPHYNPHCPRVSICVPSYFSTEISAG